jgi:hypothetical protein
MQKEYLLNIFKIRSVNNGAYGGANRLSGHVDQVEGAHEFHVELPQAKGWATTLRPEFFNIPRRSSPPLPDAHNGSSCYCS